MSRRGIESLSKWSILQRTDLQPNNPAPHCSDNLFPVREWLPVQQRFQLAQRRQHTEPRQITFENLAGPGRLSISGATDQDQINVRSYKRPRDQTNDREPGRRIEGLVAQPSDRAGERTLQCSSNRVFCLLLYKNGFPYSNDAACLAQKHENHEIPKRAFMANKLA